MGTEEAVPLTHDKSPRFFYGYIIVLAGFLTMMITHGTLYSFGVFFKPMAAEFGWARAATSGAYSLNLLLHGTWGIVAGKLNDRFGPRLVVIVSGLFLGLGYLLMSQISDIWQLYLFYGVIVSLGLSTNIPAMSTPARWFIKRRGIMTGIVVAGVGVGTVIMPPIASQIIINLDWRTAYIIVGYAAMAVMLMAAQLYRSNPKQVGQTVDGAKEIHIDNVDLGNRGFSLREAMGTRQLWLINAVFFFFLFCQQTMMVHLVPHATDIGISAVNAAGVLSTVGGMSIAGRILMGNSCDRIGSKRALVIVLTIVTTALFWLQFASDLWMLYLFAVVFGFGYGGFIALESPIVAEFFGLKEHGAILGVAVFSATTGGAIGPLVAGSVFDITDSYRLGFWVCVALSMASLILASFLKPISRKDKMVGSAGIEPATNRL